jgi:hypothetical protein
MRIPMRGAIGSLNAAVAGSVLLFEAVAQRGGEERPQGAGEPEPEPEPGPAADDPAADEPTAPTAPAKRARRPRASAATPEPSRPTEATSPTAPAKRARRPRASAATPEPSPPSADAPGSPDSDDDALLPDATPAKPTRRRSSSKRA